MPHNNVFTVTQTPDGYLWLGTSRGLCRFDGVRFVTLLPNQYPAMSGEMVRRLMVDQEGRLVIAPETGGLDILYMDQMTDLATQEGVYTNRVYDMALDAQGAVFTVTLEGEVERLWQRRVTALGKPGKGTIGPSSFARTADGVVWLASRSTVGYFQGDEWHGVLDDLPAPLTVAPRRAGGVWLMAGQRLMQVDASGVINVLAQLPWPAHDTDVRQMLEDRWGALWLATNRRGVLRFAEGVLERVPTPHPSIICLFEDREGNLWLGMQGGGLARLRLREFFVLDARSGLPSDIAFSVSGGADGRIWVVTQDGGFSVVSNGTCLSLGSADGWVRTTPLCVVVDAAGTRWVGTFSEGLIRWGNGAPEWINREKGLPGDRVNALFSDRAGRVWVGMHGQGVVCFAGTQRLHFTTAQGVPGEFVSTFAEDVLGRVWVGTAEGGVARFAGDSFQTVIPPLGAGGIHALLPTEDGSVWAGTGNGGLLRMRQGRLSRITKTEGLPDDSVFQMLPDDAGNLWCAGTRGLFRVAMRELNEAADGRVLRVSAFVYGGSDGLPDFQFSNIATPGCYRGLDGRFWFASSKGVVVFSPERLRLNPEPPPVVIEEVRANGRTLPPIEFMKLPPLTRNLEVQFTGLSFTAPDKVRFRHRLHGWDNDWVEDGGQRVARYTGLKPGEYHFQVIACNNDGVWNTRGGSFTFTISPALWETRWFLVIMVGVLTGAVAAGFRVATVRRLRRRLARLHEQHALEQERIRIAQDIHDELGASLTQIGMLASFAQKNVTNPAELQPDLTKIRETAHEAVRAMDAIVWAISPQNDSVENFAAYVSRFAEGFLPPAGIRFRFDAPAHLPAIHLGTEQRHHLFLVVREALNNVVRHARASEVWLRLAVRDGCLHLAIEDDGIGLPAGALQPGSDGLANMRQRVERMGGQFEASSQPGAGTHIRVCLPLIPNSETAPVSAPPPPTSA